MLFVVSAIVFIESYTEMVKLAPRLLHLWSMKASAEAEIKNLVRNNSKHLHDERKFKIF